MLGGGVNGWRDWWRNGRVERINIQVNKHEVGAVSIFQRMHPSHFHSLSLSPLPPSRHRLSFSALLLPQPHSVSILSDPVSTVVSPCRRWQSWGIICVYMCKVGLDLLIQTNTNNYNLFVLLIEPWYKTTKSTNKYHECFSMYNDVSPVGRGAAQASRFVMPRSHYMDFMEFPCCSHYATRCRLVGSVELCVAFTLHDWLATGAFTLHHSLCQQR